MANEHSIRVSAKGEFGQLNRGLKQLQGDLKGVLGEIDKGARKGGIFDDASLRALDLYRNRFKDSMEQLNREFEKQNGIVDRLHEKMMDASRSEKAEISEQIKLREKEMDVIRKQLFEVERLYKKRNTEASGYSMAPTAGGGGGVLGGGGGGGAGVAGLIGGGMLTRLLGGAKMVAGLAGIAGIGALANQAYQGAYLSRTMPMDLAQRIRGQNGWTGDSYNMWNRGYSIGTRDKMGYTAGESWQFHDMYSRQAGSLSDPDMEHLLKFGRAYGLNIEEVASGMGGMRELGGTMSPAHFADLIAGSVEKSGMQPRILEVLETSAGLLSQMNTTFKDTGAKQILAYQTTLDTIGNEKGMMALTGKQGANVISGLGGIYDPQNEQWKFMGMQALQRYDPNRYGSMGLYGLERTYEDGLLNDDNLPAMVQYLRENSGGDENLMKRMLQKWLQAGGFNATKTQVDELYSVTDGMTAFSKSNMEKVRGTLEAGDGTAPYDERMVELGQEILDVNARFDKQLEELGQPLLELVTNIKEGVTSGLEWFNQNESVQQILQNIFDFLGENWKSLATIGSIALLGGLLLKGLGVLGGIMTGVGTLTGKGFGALNGTMLKNLGLLGLIGGAVMGAKWLSDVARERERQKVEDLRGHYEEGFGLSPDDLEERMRRHGIAGYAELRTGVASPKVAKMLEELNNESLQRTGIVDKHGNKRIGNDWADWANTPSGEPIKDADKMADYLKNLGDSGDLNLSELNMFGQESFGDFFSMSETTFSDFFSMSDVNFSNLYKDGTESFDKLMKSGDVNFEKLYKDGSDFLGGVFEEHKGFKNLFASLWTDFTDQMVNLLGGGTHSGLVGSGVGSGYDVRNNSGVTASQLNAKLGGKLSGMGQTFLDAGNAYGIDPAFLASVAMHETGNGTSNAIRSKNNVGGMMGKNGLMSFGSVSNGINAMASNLKRLYLDMGLHTVGDIQKKYAPIGAGNDPTGLNNNWTSGVTGFLEGFGVGGGGGNPTGKSIFDNWKSRITSRFGDTAGRTTVHKGLDIDGEQGDFLEAIVGGVVSKVFYDDGSHRDKDGRANSTAGGNTVMVKMADGTSYAYAHLSKINPLLQEGMKINPGDWIGNMGGAKGVAGSGYSTTGSHLHLGYYDKSGRAVDPMKLMNRIGAGTRGMGDLDISQLDSSPASLDFTNRSLGDVVRNALGISQGGATGGGTHSTLTVKLEVDGEGAKTLNKATEHALEKLVRKVLAENERMRVTLNPSIGGY